MNEPKAADTVLVEYVGLKDQETDHLYGTGIVWIGKGDVQEVPRQAWNRGLHKHPDVWRLVEGVEAKKPTLLSAPIAEAKPAEAKPADPGAPVVVVKDYTNGELMALERDALLALAIERGLAPHKQLGKPKLLQLLGWTA